MKALIIDDDTDLCTMLESVVKNTVPNVQCASTISAGRQLVKAWKPDVVFLDNNLPDGQGLDLAKEIKHHSPSVFIVFITAVDLPKEKVTEYGIDVFLEKPLTYSAISQALEIDSKAGL